MRRALVAGSALVAALSGVLVTTTGEADAIYALCDDDWRCKIVCVWERGDPLPECWVWRPQP